MAKYKLEMNGGKKMLYAICEDFFPDVEKKLNRIAKKCEKHGNGFTFEIKGEEIRAIKKHEANVFDPDAPVEYFKFILIDVEGTAKIDNWECVAVLEYHECGNIIRRINTEIDIPEHFKHSENICEHCNSKRNRNNLYVIHNVETDDWKQVGGKCLELYTSGLNMEYVAAFMDGIAELETYDNFVDYGMCNRKYYSVKDIIAYAHEVIGKIGYFNSQSDLPTKFFVRQLVFYSLDYAIIHINKELYRNAFSFQFSKADFFKPDTADTVKKIIEYYQGLEDTSEFLHNVKVMLSEGYVNAKNIGFLCYLPEGYAKHFQTEEKKAKIKEEQEHAEFFGEVGKRYTEKVKTAECVTSWVTQWGITRIYKITLVSGENLVWKTSNPLFDYEAIPNWLENAKKINLNSFDWTGIYDLWDDGKRAWVEHKMFIDTISFTVKDHKEYKGEKQTEVTRCKRKYKA